MWNERESPLRIEKRFEFDQYSKISKFMGEIEKLCKERDIYPNISFGKNFVSLSIFLDNKEISDKEKDFSMDIDKIYFLYSPFRYASLTCVQSTGNHPSLIFNPNNIFRIHTIMNDSFKTRRHLR